ncbi:MAG: porin family protein [Prolixibacteraceae bacterium]
MKGYLLLIILASVAFSVNAQMWGIPNLTTFDDRKIHFGFTLGINTLDLGLKHYYSLDDNPAFDPTVVSDLEPNYLLELDSIGRQVRADVASLTPGFTVGIVSNLRLTESLDLRFVPGLSFGNRKLAYNVPLHDLSNSSTSDFYSLRATYIDFPLLVKYKAKRIVNQRPFMIGGLASRIDISKPGYDELVRMKKVSYYVEAGMGWDAYLQFFRLSTELKYSFGIGNALADPPNFPQPTYYTLALKRITSHMLTLSFHFE